MRISTCNLHRNNWTQCYCFIFQKGLYSTIRKNQGFIFFLMISAINCSYKIKAKNYFSMTIIRDNFLMRFTGCYFLDFLVIMIMCLYYIMEIFILIWVILREIFFTIFILQSQFFIFVLLYHFFIFFIDCINFSLHLYFMYQIFVFVFLPFCH